MKSVVALRSGTGVLVNILEAKTMGAPSAWIRSAWSELAAEFRIEGRQRDGVAVRGEDQPGHTLAAARGQAIADHQPAQLPARYAGRAQSAHDDAIVEARTGTALDPPGAAARFKVCACARISKRSCGEGLQGGCAAGFFTSRPKLAWLAYQTSKSTRRDMMSTVGVAPRRPWICAQPVMPGLTSCRRG